MWRNTQFRTVAKVHHYGHTWPPDSKDDPIIRRYRETDEALQWGAKISDTVVADLIMLLPSVQDFST